MKRVLSFLILIAVVFTVCGCTLQQQKIDQPVNYYYKATEIGYEDTSGVIKPEQRENRGHEDAFTYHIENYLAGPKSADLQSAFPADVSLVDLNFEMNTATVTLSQQMTLLSGKDLTIACTCLGKTLLELTGCKVVKICIQNNLIDGRPYYSISANSHLLIDNTVLEPTELAVGKD